MDHRGILFHGQAGQRRHRHQHYGFEHPPVHGGGGVRLHEHLWLRRPARVLRRHREHRLLFPDRHQPGRDAPAGVAAHHQRAPFDSRAQDDRGRPAPHRHRAQRRSAPAAQTRHQRGADERHPAAAHRQQLDRQRLYQCAHPQFRRARGQGRGLHADLRRRDYRTRGCRHPDRGAVDRPVARGMVDVHPGRVPVDGRHRHSAPDLRHAPDHRHDRPPRLVALLHHRSGHRDEQPRNRRFLGAGRLPQLLQPRPHRRGGTTMERRARHHSGARHHGHHLRHRSAADHSQHGRHDAQGHAQGVLGGLHQPLGHPARPEQVSRLPQLQ